MPDRKPIPIDDTRDDEYRAYLANHAYSRGAANDNRDRGQVAANLDALGHGVGSPLMAILNRATGLGEDADTVNRINQAKQAAMAEKDAELQDATGVPDWLFRGARNTANQLPGMLASGAVGGLPGMIAHAAAMEGNESVTAGRDAGLSDDELKQHVAQKMLTEGGVTAAFSAVGLGGAERAIKESFAKEGLAGLRRSAAKLATKEGLKKVAKQVGKPIGEELAEELTIETLHAIESKHAGVEPDALDADSLMETWRDTAVQTILTMGAIKGQDAALGAYQRRADAARAKERQREADDVQSALDAFDSEMGLEPDSAETPDAVEPPPEPVPMDEPLPQEVTQVRPPLPPEEPAEGPQEEPPQEQSVGPRTPGKEVIESENVDQAPERPDPSGPPMPEAESQPEPAPPVDPTVPSGRRPGPGAVEQPAEGTIETPETTDSTRQGTPQPETAGDPVESQSPAEAGRPGEATGDSVEVEGEASVPAPETMEELEALPKYSVYRPKGERQGRFLVRGDGQRGGGDPILGSLQEAQEEARRMRSRDEQQQADAEQRANQEAEDEAVRVEREDLRGYLDDAGPMRKGRAVKTLTKQFNFDGTQPKTVRDFIEDAVANREGYVDDGQFFYKGKDGEFVTNKAVNSKTAVGFAEHYLANRGTPATPPATEAPSKWTPAPESGVIESPDLRVQRSKDELKNPQFPIDKGSQVTVYRPGEEGQREMQQGVVENDIPWMPGRLQVRLDDGTVSRPLMADVGPARDADGNVVQQPKRPGPKPTETEPQEAANQEPNQELSQEFGQERQELSQGRQEFGQEPNQEQRQGRSDIDPEMRDLADAVLDELTGVQPKRQPKPSEGKKPRPVESGQFVLGFPGMREDVQRQERIDKYRRPVIERIEKWGMDDKTGEPRHPGLRDVAVKAYGPFTRALNEVDQNRSIESPDDFANIEAFKELEGVLREAEDDPADLFGNNWGEFKATMMEDAVMAATELLSNRPKRRPKPKSKIGQAAQSSRDRAKKSREALKDAVLESIRNPEVSVNGNAKLMRLAMQAAIDNMSAGVLTFAEHVESFYNDFPEHIQTLAPYIEAGWDAIYRRGMVDDSAGKVSEVLGDRFNNEGSSDGETDGIRGQADQGESGAVDVDGQDAVGGDDASFLGSEPSQDVQGTEAGGSSQGVRDRPGGQVPERAETPGRSGVDDSVGGGTGGGRSSTSGPRRGRGGRSGGDGRSRRAGKRGTGRDSAPPATRPNYHLTDPDSIVGGGQKAKFKRNQEAIRIVREIQTVKREPTNEELDTLASYTGWGAFGQELFNGSWKHPRPKEGWEDADEWLRDFLGEEDWKSAQNSIINAHFTDPEVVEGMWDMMRRMGFDGGRVLEPSLGVGNFFAMMPRDMMERSHLTGIELDTVSAQIAEILYPQANIQQKGYQDSKTPDNFYTAAITNVPFGNVPISDPRYRTSYSVHNYFFRRSIDQLQPGGIQAFITSNMTMDGTTQAKLLRKQLASRADLVAAFRFPSGAFQRYAGTKVVADLIILRKRKPGEPDNHPAWIEDVLLKTPSGKEVRVNEYWKDHPENILGTLNYGSGTTSGRPGMIVDLPTDLKSAWKKAVESVPQGIYDPDPNPFAEKSRPNRTGRRQNSVVAEADDLFIVKGEQLTPLLDAVKWYRKGSKPATIKKNRERIQQAIETGDVLMDVLDTQARGEDAGTKRKKLNELYDKFVADHGPMSKSPAVDALVRAGDPRGPALSALERLEEDGAYTKRPIFTGTTVRQKRDLKNPTLNDAYAMARNESFKLDMDRVAEIANMSRDGAIKDLTSRGLIYKTAGGHYEPADMFLFGNMAHKIRELEAAKAEGVEGLDASIAKAKEVLPEPIPYNQIDVTLGAPWVDSGDYAAFLGHLLNMAPENFTVERRSGRWKARFPDGANSTPEAGTVHGHPQVPFSRMFYQAMNNGTVTVRIPDPEDPTGKRKVVDPNLTAEANAKLDELRTKFKEWIWQDQERIGRLSRVYNEEMNSTVTPDFKDVPLEFEGLALQRGDDPFSLRSHQESAVWRGIVSGRGLFAHEVGTGKTLTMGALAMESRRLGLASKPVLFAHNANASAVRSEIQEAYPNARILYVNNLDTKGRDSVLSSIAMEDWDLVVVPHSLVDRFQLRPETLRGVLQSQLDELESAAKEAFEEDEGNKGEMPDNLDEVDDDDMKQLRSPTAKELVKERNKLVDMIRKATAAAEKDSTIFVDDMGIDMLMVDEAHVFKKLPISSAQRLKGLNKAASIRGNLLLMLADYVRSKNADGRGVHLFTGTPVTNTLNEIYNMMRFTMPTDMEKAGVKDWDTWFATFASASSDVELSSGGTWEEFSRLRSFVNVPELKQMAGRMMDVVFASQMPEFKPRSSREGRMENPEGVPYMQSHTVTIQLTPEQRRHSKNLKERYESFKELTGREKVRAKWDNPDLLPIVLETEGTLMTMDPRLVGLPVSDPKDPSLKINKMMERAMTHYHEHPKSAQMIFMQVGHSDSVTRTAGRDVDGKPIKERSEVFNVAKEIKRRLIEEGVAEKEIVLFSTLSEKQRPEVAAKMREGKVRFGIGSTQTMGTGVNAQDELVAMHHLDAPWMPGDRDQRNGRGRRQGNKWNTVHEYKYIAESPQEGRRWQVLMTKDRFIKQLLDENVAEREIDMDDVDLSDDGTGTDMEATFAAAVGDPRVLQRQKLERGIAKMEAAETRHARSVQDAVGRARREQRDAVALQEGVELMKDDYDTFRSTREEGDATPKVTIRGKVYEGQKDITAVLGELENKYRDSISVTPIEVGEYRGLPLRVNNGSLRMGKSDIGVRFSLASLQNIANNLPGRIEKAKEKIQKADEFVELARKAAAEPFPRKAQLEARRKKLAELIQEMQDNPESSPTWFRNVTPVRSAVYVDGKMYEVAGHRGDHSVLIEADGGLRPVPAKEVTDAEGTPLYSDDMLGGQSESPGRRPRPRNQADVLEQGDAPETDAMGFGPGGGSRRAMPRRPDVIPSEVKADDPDVEQALTDAFGIRKKSMWDSVVDFYQTFIRKFRPREFLPQKGTRGAFFAPANDILRRMQDLGDRSQDHATRLVAGMLTPLGGAKQYAVFNRKVLADNMVAAREAGQPLRFRFGSDRELMEYHEKVTKVAESIPAVKEAIENRRVVSDELVRELVSRDLLPESALENVGAYYHQMVLSYAQSERFLSGNSPVRRSKSFQKRRVEGGEDLGERADYNTNFVEAEIAWMTDAFTVLDVEKSIQAIRNQYDIKKQVVQDKKEKERNTGDTVHWESMIPDGYSVWSPQPGNVFYPVLTVPERIVEQFQAGIAESLELTQDDLRMAYAIGGVRDQMVLPDELVQQLEAMQKKDPPDAVRNAARGLMRSWKEWILHKPTSIVGYSLRNVTGDLDATIAGAPGALSFMGEAARELKDYLTGAKLSMSDELRAARDHSVIDSGLVAEELSSLKEVDSFVRFFEDLENRRGANLIRAYRQKAGEVSRYREGVLRYAAFRYFREQLRNGDLSGYGASRRENVEAVRKALGPDAAAAKLAREMLGDYGDISVHGQWLRQYMIPFWSFQEINIRRYPALLRNAWRDGNMGGVTISGSAKAGALAMRAGAMYAAIHLFNQMVFGDEEEELPFWERVNPHVILGRTSDGRIRVFRNVGALGDFLEWFNLNELITDAPRYFRGELDATDIPGEMGKTFVNRIVSGLTPVLKTPYELVGGVSTFPDALNQRMVPRDEVLAGSAGLIEEWRAARGVLLGTGQTANPHYFERLFGHGVVNPQDAAMSDIRSAIHRYKENNGLDTNRTLGISKYRTLKQSAVNGDYESFVKARETFLEAEPDREKAYDKFVDFANRLDPIESSLSAEHEAKFMERLTVKEKEKAKASREYAAELRERLAVFWEAASREHDSPEDRKRYLEYQDERYERELAKIHPSRSGSTWKSGRGQPNKPRRPLKTREAASEAWKEYDEAKASYDRRMSLWDGQQEEARNFVDRYRDMFGGNRGDDIDAEMRQKVVDLARGKGSPRAPDPYEGDEPWAQHKAKMKRYLDDLRKFREAQREARDLVESLNPD